MKQLILILSLISSFAFQAQISANRRDTKFVKCAAEGSIMEVKLGQLALQNGSSPEVKKLAQHMVDDHTKAGNELKVLAERKSLSMPTTMSEKQQKMYDKLAALKGEKFDKAYAKAMVKDHKKDICLFKKEARKGDDMDLKAWADSTLITLKHHKEMADETCKAVK